MLGSSGEKILRRSPRTNLPSEEKMGKKRQSPANPNALSLSLHVIGNEDDATPLRTCEPQFSAERFTRRSSRFTNNKYRSPTEPVNPNALSLSLHVIGNGDDATPLRTCESQFSAERFSRRSSRFTNNKYRSPTEQSRDPIRVKLLRALSPGSPVRRSPRLSSGTAADGHGMVSEFEKPGAALSLKRRRPGGSSDDESSVWLLCDSPKKVQTSKGRSEATRSSPRFSCNTPDPKPEGTIKSTLGSCGNEEMKNSGKSCESDLVGKSLRNRIIPVRAQDPADDSGGKLASPQKNTRASSEKKKQSSKQEMTSFFVGDPIPEEEARERWGWRYDLKNQRSKRQSWKLNAGEEDEIILNVECHYAQANVVGCIFNLGDCAYVKGDGRQKHVGRILEFFKTTDGEDYIRAQWFYRAEDTVLKDVTKLHDKKRLFFSTVVNDNLLDCIISKVTVIQIAPTLDLQTTSIPTCDFYYDTEYCVEYSTFRNMLTDDSIQNYDLSSPEDIKAFSALINAAPLEDVPTREPFKSEYALLDLYSGCGGMSTGLCLGAKLSSINLVTRWAVDADNAACDTLKLNHPETKVRNEAAEDFLELLKEWEKLCCSHVSKNLDREHISRAKYCKEAKSSTSPPTTKPPAGEYEVQRLVDICFGDPSETGKRGLYFKVRWLGYSPAEDTWEPIEGLSNCEERIQDFVRSGFNSKLLPLPGDVHVLCGGPPCQGISGYNRFRNTESPLDDERNRQVVVFMDIVKFLRPKYVLMENVVDILKFDKASLARYALSRLVHMKYQVRLGMMAAGCYGLPQFRLRAFVWGALPCQKLPQFPLPTHDVVVKYWPPSEFERNTVAYDEGEPRDLEEAIVLRDAISDLPAVSCHEVREEMAYKMPPETEFQKYIRLTKNDMLGFANGVTDTKKCTLYDHRPYQLSEDDYLRVCQIPHQKGANFRNLPGVVVGPDNVARRDPSKEQILLPSGRPMVPDYAFTFEQGKSRRPFARLWWDETVPTLVTFPSIHCQPALHPEQDRPLTIRECARLQGFPDYYRFCGTVKKRYRQIGNAVAVPVGKALGYTLGLATQKLGGNEPLMTLPPKFAFQQVPTD